MALSGTVLGKQISSAIKLLTAEEKLDTDAVWTAIGNEIVSHIQTAGVVTTTVSTAVQTVPTTGTGTGTGTGAGGIS